MKAPRSTILIATTFARSRPLHPDPGDGRLCGAGSRSLRAAELVERALARRAGAAAGSGVCALCRLPAHRLHPDAAALATATVAAIRGDFPE
jgi:hypothetical protein